MLSQGRSVSSHQCKGAAQFLRDGNHLSTTPSSLELGRERGIGKSHHPHGAWLPSLGTEPNEGIVWSLPTCETGIFMIFLVQTGAHAQRGYSTLQRSHSKEVAEVEFKLNSESTKPLLSAVPTSGGQ